MLFITEDNLRNEYYKNSFDTYIVQKGTKLTPQARQFLIDFKIDIIEENKLKKKKSSKKEMGSTKTDNSYNKNIALLLKELAIFIKDYDMGKAAEVNDFAKKLYINESISLEKKDNHYEEAFDIYMNMNLNNPYLKVFPNINNIIEELKSIKEVSTNDNLIDNIISDVLIWFIHLSNGGEKY